MKKKKFDLKSLEVRSFITEMEKRRYFGGLQGASNNGLGCTIDDDCG